MPSQTRRRELAATALVIAATLMLPVAMLAGYARRAVFDSDQFSNRASAALEDQGVRRVVAEKLTDDVILKADSSLTAARPILQGAAEGVVGSDAFLRLFRAGVRDVHRAVFDRDRNTVTLTVADAGVLFSQAVETLDPKLAKRTRAVGNAELVDEKVGGTAELARVAEKVRGLAVLLWVLTVALWIAAVAVSQRRRETVVRLGVGVVGAGLVLVAGLVVGRAIVLGLFDDSDARTAAAAVWNAFLGDLRTGALVVAGCGAVVAAAASSLIKPVGVEEPLRRAGAFARRVLTTEPASPRLALARGLGLVAVGLLVIAQRDAILELALTLAGLYVVYKGVEGLLRLIAAPDAEERPDRARPRPGALRLRRVGAGAVAALLVAGAIGAFVGGGGTSEAAPSLDTCNGHRELCDKRFDEVALPATHNSMAVPLPGWFSIEQDRPIADQLDDGVRGLLIDTHYGVKLPGGKVRTDLEDQKNTSRAKFVDEVGPKAVDAALRIRNRLGFSGKGKRDIFLCHTFCEIGATELDTVLTQIHDFLIANPTEVLLIINQDAVTPKDFTERVHRAGLDKMLYRGSTTRWQTLGEMVQSDQRLVVLAEEDAGRSDWYHPAYKRITKETPFTFTSADLTDPSRLTASCEPNRGPESAPLFLINHWVSTDPAPRPKDADRVNAYKPLLARARHCEKQRHHLPTVLAVNFYLRGDVFKVVDELNGVR